MTLTDLQDAKKADDMLKSAIETILSDIEQTINEKMKEYNDSFFPEPHKPPHLHYNEYNSYRFETPYDTGTGSNYKRMVIFDLAALNLTALPAIAHAPAVSAIRAVFVKAGIADYFLMIVGVTLLAWLISVIACYLTKKIAVIELIFYPTRWIRWLK